MGAKNYIVLAEDLSLTDRMNYRLRAMAAGIARAYSKKVCTWDATEVPSKFGSGPTFDEMLAWLKLNGMNPPKDVAVREFEPILDAGTPLDSWRTAALAAADTEYSIFQNQPVPVIALRATKEVVWYGVQIEGTALPVSRIIFRKTVAAGMQMASFNLEQLLTGEKWDGFFSEPQIWDANMPYAINVLARTLIGGGVTGVAAVVIPHNFVIEPAGQRSQ